MWKHQPLVIHKDAPLAHVASMAAAEQGRFWEYHDKLFENQKQLKRDNLLEYARQLQLDMARFEKDLLDSRFQRTIEADTAEARGVGSTGTPAFFINGRYLSGAKPFTDFAQVINAELDRLKLPVPADAQIQ